MSAFTDVPHRTPLLVGTAFLLVVAGAAVAMMDISPTDERRKTEMNGTTYVVRGNSMSGILSSWQEIRLRKGTAKKGDVVVLKTGVQNPERIVKRVLATEGDRFECRSGRCYVNGGILETSNATPYLADSKMLEEYAREYPTLPKNAILVMGNLAEGTYDSSVFGFGDVSDVIGIVQN